MLGTATNEMVLLLQWAYGMLELLGEVEAAYYQVLVYQSFTSYIQDAEYTKYKESNFDDAYATASVPFDKVFCSIDWYDSNILVQLSQST